MITFAVQHGGRWHVLNAGPGTMIGFEDEFGKSMPDGTDGAHMWRHIAWIAHRELAATEPFDEWIRTLTDLTADDDRIAEIRAELAGDAPDQEHEQEPDPTPLRAAAGAPA
jgi:hypothetical protein